MDLKDLTPTSDTIDVVLVHPVTLEPLLNDDGSQMTITMYAPHSKEYKAYSHKQTNERLKQSQAKKRVEITAEGLEEAVLNLYANVTKDWNITFDKKQPKCSVAKAKEIYSEVFWLRDQIEEAITNSLDFTKK